MKFLIVLELLLFFQEFIKNYQCLILRLKKILLKTYDIISKQILILLIFLIE